MREIEYALGGRLLVEYPTREAFRRIWPDLPHWPGLFCKMAADWRRVFEASVGEHSRVVWSGQDYPLAIFGHTVLREGWVVFDRRLPKPLLLPIYRLIRRQLTLAAADGPITARPTDGAERWVRLVGFEPGEPGEPWSYGHRNRGRRGLGGCGVVPTDPGAERFGAERTRAEQAGHSGGSP